MFSTIIRVCCDWGMGNTHIGSRKKDWIVERECKGYLRRGRDKSSVTTKIVALQPQGWEVVNNNYPRGYFSFNSGLIYFTLSGHHQEKRKKRNDFDRQRGNVEESCQRKPRQYQHYVVADICSTPSPILQAHPPHDDQYLSKTYVSLMTHHWYCPRTSATLHLGSFPNWPLWCKIWKSLKSN